MNWTKIKTIMIFFLITMNLFMVAFIAVTTFRNTHIPDEVIQASVDILKRDGFDCDKELIPTSTYKLPILDTSFYSAGELSDMFFGRQLPFRTDKDSLIAGDGDATLIVSGNYFLFDSSKKADKSFSEKKIKAALKKAGINMDGAVYDEKENCFYRMYKGENLFNMYIKAELDKDGNLCKIEAQWPGELRTGEEKNLSFVTSVTKVKDVFPDGGKITLIEKGYSLTPLGNENYRFIPAWRIKADNKLKIIE